MGGGGAQQPAAARQPAPETQASALPQPRSFEDVVALARENREGLLEAHLTDNVHLVRFQPGRIELRPGDRAPPDLVGKLGQRLSEWTGQRWVVTVSREQGDPTLHEQKQAAHQRMQDEVSAHPLVQAALRAFPGAQLTSIIDTAPAEAPSPDGEAMTDADPDEFGDIDP
jgi:DNA polymerase-3 subunit gamma/tau